MTLPFYMRAFAAAIIFAVIGAVLGTVHHIIWKSGYNAGKAEVQANWDADKAKQAQANLKQAAENHAKEQAWNKQLEEARNEAEKLKAAKQHDDAAARAVNDSLRNELAAAKLAMSGASIEALTQYANALSDVFRECTDRYTALAEKAGGHAIDAQTMNKGWPH